MKRLILNAFCSVIISIVSTSVQAAKPKLNNVSKGELDAILEEFAANFVHTSVSPAKSLGAVWGVEVGVVAGITETPELEKLVKKADANTTVDKIPHAGALLAGSVPYGIGFEINMFPEKTFSGIKIKNTGGALKWTVSDVFFSSLPIDVAVKAHYSKSTLSYSQTINNSSTANTDVDSTITVENKIKGANITVSGDILIFQPFVGFGFAESDGKVGVTASGTATIFDQSITATNSQSASSKPSSAHLFAGLQFDLWLVNIAAEYTQVFGAKRYSAKFSFHF